jgi:hypothetical protein
MAFVRAFLPKPETPDLDLRTTSHPLMPAVLLGLIPILVALGILAPPVGAQQIPNTLQYTIPSPAVTAQGNTRLGTSVAVDGRYLVTGMPGNELGGEVKVFDFASGNLVYTLVNPSPAMGDAFGSAVAISGTRIIVGASEDDDGDTNVGAVYVYDLTHANPTLPIAILRSPKPAANERFGISVSVSGNWAVVGCLLGDAQGGSAYAYDLSVGKPPAPVFELRNPNPSPSDGFGTNVAVSGTRIAVSSPGDDTDGVDSGRVYVYDAASATPTAPIAALHKAVPMVQDYFGGMVAISGTRIVVGHSLDDTNGTNAGAAYVFNLQAASPSTPVAVLARPAFLANAHDYFGESVAISGARVLVSFRWDDTGAHAAGSVYVYDVTSGQPAGPLLTWYNPTPQDGDEFGSSVAISGSRAIIGAPLDDTVTWDAGSAYVYDLDGATPFSSIKTLNSRRLASVVQYGGPAALSGMKVVLGANTDGAQQLEEGSARVYDLASATPSIPVVTLKKPNPAAYDHFGSVAMSGSLVAVGAYGDSTRSSSAGSVFLFDLAGPTPGTPYLIIENPEPAPGDLFGGNVAISGSRLVVGASSDDTGATDAGCIYVYNLSSSTPSVPILKLSNPEPAEREYFGSPLAMSGSRLLASVWNKAVGKGAVYVYDLDGATPAVPVATLNNPEPDFDDFFGQDLAILGTRVVVSAPGDDTEVANAGSAYVYELSSGTPTVPVATLRNPDPNGSFAFGWGIALSGSRVLIGALPKRAGPSKTQLFDLAGETPTDPIATLVSPIARYYEPVAIYGSLAMVGPDVFGPDENVTGVPSVFAPVSNSVIGKQIAVEYQLPEAAAPGSLKLTFSGPSTITLTLSDLETGSGSHSIGFDATSPTLSSHIASGGAIPDGIYEVTLSYQDALGNPSASATVTNVLVDATVPTIAGTFSPLVLMEGPLPSYAQQTVVADAFGLAEVRQTPAAGAIVAAGPLNVTLTVKDIAGNEASTAFNILVLHAPPPFDLIFADGDDAPGSGTADGPPIGAKLATFGVPAIDANGHVAVVAAWKSVEGSGYGIFKDNACLAKARGAVPGLASATYKTLNDPVIDAANVAFLATLAGVPKSQSAVVMSDTSGTLEVVAQGGTIAPGTGGSTLKSFRAVAISGDSVGVLAQLTPGTGSVRTTSANDLGIWVKEGLNPLTLVLREGQEMAPGKVIKTLVSFAGGNGSPGQGRGWLIDSGDSVQVLVGATFVDKSQAIVAVPLNDVAHPVVLSQSGIAGDSGASFASYGLPATNADNQRVFLGSLTVGAGGVTKANARGIFADLNGSGAFSPIVRTGDPVMHPGGVIGLLKDPVLAAEGGLAFPATTKGSGIKGAEAQTLWWKPAGGELTLLAQGGAGAVTVADIPGAQWKSFRSLAIAANRGPIFTGTLVSGKGGVTKATSSGVWAVDFKGDLRLLFQAGVTLVDGKKVKSFTLLNANVGSQGSTRSFNDNAQVVWRAILDDKTQAIVRTEVP